MVDRRIVIAGIVGVGLAFHPSAAVAPFNEGFAKVPGGRVWWRRVGSGSRIPLLTLHGGPGAGHDYLTPLERLRDQRPVILYDQLGCGKSDKPNDARLWCIERFCDEIDAVRHQLDLKEVILYGHSWGGWLALEYLARRGRGAPVEALILASTSASMSQFVDGTQKL